MVDSRLKNIENFAIELIDKVTLRAMDIVEASSDDTDALNYSPNRGNTSCRKCNEPKIRNRSMRIARQQKINSERLRKNCCCDAEEIPRKLPTNISIDMGEKTNEEIRKIVEGLRGVQIGDSNFVQPIREISNLERQVKNAVEEMSCACEILGINGPIVEGQGDVDDKNGHEMIVTSIAEINYTEQEKPEKLVNIADNIEKPISKNKNQLSRQMEQRIEPEVSKLRSTCFLHRMIEELENAQVNQENVMDSVATMSIQSQENLAQWEEKEEKFIRTIEGSREENRSIGGSPIIDDDFAIFSSNKKQSECLVDVTIEELVESGPTSSPPTPISSSSPAVAPPLPVSSRDALERPETREISTLPSETAATMKRTKMQNKKSVVQRLRRFFRSAFKRGKDC